MLDPYLGVKLSLSFIIESAKQQQLDSGSPINRRLPECLEKAREDRTMNRSKDSRISKAHLINEGLLEKDQGEEESISEEFVPAPLLTISEAAKSLGIGRKELYRLIEWGEINTIRSGDSIRVEGKSLEAFKTGGKTMSV